MFKILIIFVTYVSLVSTDHFCGNWESFKDEKCFKVINKEKLVTYEEAVELCSQSESGSTLITIHSKEEQEFLSKYLFETQEIAVNVWLDLKKSNNKFEWIDKTSVEFTNWANGSPGNISDKNCVEMSSDSNPKGMWIDIQCSRKLIAVCEKYSYIYIKKLLFETQNSLKETQKQLNNKEKQLTETSSNLTQCLNRVGNPSNSFTDSDGRQRAFIFPLNENKNKANWDEANNICLKYNATLVEINSQQKQNILDSFLKQLEIKYGFWLNARKDSSGKWKWSRSGNDFTFTNWHSTYPLTNSGYDYLAVESDEAVVGLWFNVISNSYHYTICEIEIKLHI